MLPKAILSAPQLPEQAENQAIIAKAEVTEAQLIESIEPEVVLPPEAISKENRLLETIAGLPVIASNPLPTTPPAFEGEVEGVSKAGPHLFLEQQFLFNGNPIDYNALGLGIGLEKASSTSPWGYRLGLQYTQQNIETQVYQRSNVTFDSTTFGGGIENMEDEVFNQDTEGSIFVQPGIEFVSLDSFYQIRSSNLQFHFLQLNLAFQYKIGNRWSVGAGILPGLRFQEPQSIIRGRFFDNALSAQDESVRSGNQGAFQSTFAVEQQAVDASFTRVGFDFRSYAQLDYWLSKHWRFGVRFQYNWTNPLRNIEQNGPRFGLGSSLQFHF